MSVQTKRATRPVSRLSVGLGLAVLGVGGAVYAGSKVADVGPKPEAWYDAAPLLVSLSLEARSGLAQALGVARAEDLTLYDLDLAYDDAAATFALGEDVWFTNTTATALPDLVFRIYANASPPDSGTEVQFLSGVCLGDARCGFTTASPSAVRVTPLVPILPGGRLHLKLLLKGALTHIDASRTSFLAQGLEGMRSIFAASAGGGGGGTDYGLLAVGDGIVSFGNFYAVLARRVGDTWETEEASKLGDLGSDVMANFRARLLIPEHAKVAVTGKITSDGAARASAPGEGARASRREVAVAAAAIRDFAFVFGDALDVATRASHGTEVRSYFLTRDRAAGTRVLDIAVHALEDYERRFGPYPYAGYSVSESAIVGGAGGVEFSGLVTAASMFYQPVAPGPAKPPTNGAPSGGGLEGGGLDGLMSMLGGLTGGMSGMTDGMLEFVVAHETAHQWWHGLVGSDSRDHPYVDEALAQYSSIIYLEDRYGPARAEKDGATNVKMNFQTMRLLGKPDVSADQPVAAYGDTIQYAGIVYGKAPYFYQAVRKAIGDTAFFAALRAYASEYRFRVAPGRALVARFVAASSDAKIRPLERRWLDEAHGDEDLGSFDLSSMLGGAGGAPGGGAIPDLNEVMKMLQGAGNTLPSGGGAGGGSKAAPGPGDVDVNELLKMFGGAP